MSVQAKSHTVNLILISTNSSHTRTGLTTYTNAPNNHTKHLYLSVKIYIGLLVTVYNKVEYDINRMIYNIDKNIPCILDCLNVDTTEKKKLPK